MADTSAFDQPEARGLRLIIGTLRVVVSAQCFGAGALRFLRPGESNIAALLSAGQRVDTALLPTVDQVTGGILIACGIFSLTRPCWPILGPLVVFFFSDSVAKLGQGEHWTLYVEPIEHAVRIATPLALLLVDWYPPKSKFSLWRFMSAGTVIRQATAATFLGHGVIALHSALHGGAFALLIQGASWHLTDRSLPDEVVSYALVAIGAIDIAVALNLMLTRSRAVAVYMVSWGFLTAASRVFVFDGLEGVAEMIVRFANGGAPLVVFLYWTLAIREREHVILPRTKGRPRRSN